MAKNYISSGELLDHTPTAARTSGQMVVIGTKVGICTGDIAANTAGVLAVEGIWTVNKLSTDTVAQGAALYWDNTNSRLTTTASGNTYAGYAAAAAGSGTTTVAININR